MRSSNSVLAVTLLLLTIAASVQNVAAQTQRSEHTYKLDNPGDRPAAKLSDVAWMAGSWSGEAFDDVFEEVWNPPSAGSMIGLFKLLKNNQVVFYELLLISEEEGSLSLKVKHFNDDFTAWEEKEDFVRFRLVKIEENAVHFSGLSFYRINDNEMHGYLVLRNEEKSWEEELIYRRRE